MSGPNESHGKVLKRADPSTIQDKFMVGYQGWFTCPGDGEPVGPGHHGWLHWFNYPMPDGGRPNTDLWPDVSEYSPSELFPASGLKFASGDQAFLFSSRHPKTVRRHFHWMAQHGVDGTFLQRFAGQCDLETGNEGIRRIRDEVGDRVREAAESEGRVFAIMYDVSGVAPERIQRVLERDWIHLIHEKGILDSLNYLREKGKAVVALWGFGFADSHHDPSVVRAITSFIRNNTPGGAYIMAGTPAHWRTSTSDADTNPEFLQMWLDEFDAISPWTVGRYGNIEDADRFAEEKIKGDLKLINQRNSEVGNGGRGRKIDYIPVILPGGSGFNLSEGAWGWNGIPRLGGKFLWRQIFNARRQGVRIMYGAMWDEYDEGTAFIPVVSSKRELPVSDKYNFMALDEDGLSLPPDWYMRICGLAGESLRGERLIHESFPSKELEDYWSTRPHYEDKSESDEPSGSGQAKGQTWEEWSKAEKEAVEGLPPPPYSLEVDDSSAQSSSSSAPNLEVASDSQTEQLSFLPEGNLTSSPSSRPALAASPNLHPYPPLHISPHKRLPPLPSSPRPEIAPTPHAHLSRHSSIASITDGLGRQTLSSASPSPRLEDSPLLQRPGPTQPPQQSPTYNPVYGFPVAQIPTSDGYNYPSYGGGTSYMSNPAGPPQGQQTSQAPWPPTEWGIQSGQSHSQSPYTSPGPPPLRPRPSQSSSNPQYSPQPPRHDTLHARPPPGDHCPIPAPGQLSPYGLQQPPLEPIIDHRFPQVRPPFANDDYHDNQGSYGPYPSAPPGAYPFPGSPSYPYYEEDYGRPTSGFPTPYSNAYNASPPPSSSYGPPPIIYASPPPPPPRPPAHPSSYSVPRLSAGPLDRAIDVVGNVAGPGAKSQFQNLTQSGEKLFRKFRK